MPTVNRVTVREKDYGFIRVPEIDFFGPFAKSPSDEYTIAWRDRAHVERDGVMEVIPGRYVLLRGGELLVDARMQRPQDGKVADDGTFVLNDWSDNGELSGTFHALDATGRPLVSLRFTANLHNNGLSPDGRHAVCQACNAPGSPDSSRLTLFDLRHGTEIASWVPEPGWACDYVFPGDGVVELSFRDLGRYRYKFDGAFLDRSDWLSDGVAAGDRYIIGTAISARPVDRTLSNDDLRRGFEKAIASAFDDRDRASIERMLGEFEETADAPEEALAAYDRALALNPKVGVRRRADSLRRELARR